MQLSRFPVHDEDSAPHESRPILRGAAGRAGARRLPNLIGVLAGSPAVLRGFARFRAELRHGALDLATLERIALAVAEHYRCEPGLELHRRAAGGLGLARDEVALACEWDSYDDHQAALLRLLKPLVVDHEAPAEHVHEEAREAGWSDAQVLEAIAYANLEAFSAMVTVAGDVPADALPKPRRDTQVA
ncbi:MAG TPA: carboxymuconolactone decarboxylase family protein [Baekduia sp.]|nr:carboxymuconolactone decarboxylase family protein [Baekduia sp.]